MENEGTIFISADEGDLPVSFDPELASLIKSLDQSQEQASKLAMQADVDSQQQLLKLIVENVLPGTRKLGRLVFARTFQISYAMQQLDESVRSVEKAIDPTLSDEELQHIDGVIDRLLEFAAKHDGKLKLPQKAALQKAPAAKAAIAASLRALEADEEDIKQSTKDLSDVESLLATGNEIITEHGSEEDSEFHGELTQALDLVQAAMDDGDEDEHDDR